VVAPLVYIMFLLLVLVLLVVLLSFYLFVVGWGVAGFYTFVVVCGSYGGNVVAVVTLVVAVVGVADVVYDGVYVVGTVVEVVVVRWCGYDVGVVVLCWCCRLCLC